MMRLPPLLVTFVCVAACAPRPEAESGGNGPDLIFIFNTASPEAAAAMGTEPPASVPFTFREAERFRLTQRPDEHTAVLERPASDTSALSPAFLVVTLRTPDPIADRQAYARRTAGWVPAVGNLEIDTVESRIVAGLEGVQATARGIRAGTPVRIVQWVGVAPDGRSIRMIGMAPAAEFDALQPAFEALRDGVSLKDG